MQSLGTTLLLWSFSPKSFLQFLYPLWVSVFLPAQALFSVKWWKAKQNAAFSITLYSNPEQSLYYAGLKWLHNWPYFVAGTLFSTIWIAPPSLDYAMSLGKIVSLQRKALDQPLSQHQEILQHFLLLDNLVHKNQSHYCWIIPPTCPFQIHLLLMFARHQVLSLVLLFLWNSALKICKRNVQKMKLDACIAIHCILNIKLRHDCCGINWWVTFISFLCILFPASLPTALSRDPQYIFKQEPRKSGK